MSLKLDVEKSIQRERLIFKKNWDYVMEFLFGIAVYLIWTICSILLILNPENGIGEIGITILVLINILLLISWYLIYNLLKIKVSNPERDRIAFVKILKERFPDLTINDNGVHMLRSRKPNGLFSWGKLLTVIFEGNQIFINLITLGRNETKSPFHSISNYLILKSIRKEFNKKTAYNSGFAQ
jgi:hypothetical protein